MSDPKIAIAITADDKTAKGRKAAEKNLGQIPKHVSAVSRRAWADDERRVGSHGRAMVRTFGEVERAGAKMFGGRSISSGVTARMGAMREMAAGLGSGLGEASAAGGVLSSTIGAVGVAAAGTIGILAAAGYAAVKFATSWADGAAQIGRTAEIIGVQTKALQEFEAAAQRAGLAKGAGTGALGSLSQTLNDARYGRNSDAMGVLGKLGIGMQLNADGTVNVEAMLPAIADAVARQNSSGRRTLVQKLGMSTDAIPLFSQGAKKMGAEMKNADGTAAVLSDDDIDLGKRVARENVIAGQWKDREIARAGAVTARGGQAVVDGAREFAGTVQKSFKPAAEKIERAASSLERAALRIEDGRLTAGQVARHAKHGQSLVDEAMRYGFSRAEAIGIAANVEMESGGNHRSRERGGSGAGRGLIQWTDPRRKALFRQIMGVDVEHSSRDQQWRFIRWETQHSERRNWERALAHGEDGGDIAGGYARYVERPQFKARDSADRAAVADAIAINLKVEGLPSGTKLKATGPGPRPTISSAHTP